MTVCTRVQAGADAHAHTAVWLLKLLSPFKLGDVAKTPGICLVGNQPCTGFSVSRAEMKPPEIQLRLYSLSRQAKDLSVLQK